MIDGKFHVLREGFPKEAASENHEGPGASLAGHTTSMEAGKSSCDPETERRPLGPQPGGGGVHTQRGTTEERGGKGAPDGQQTSPGRKTVTDGSDILRICSLQRTHKSSHVEL